MDTALGSREYYLKGSWRHWFWAVLALCLVSFVLGLIIRVKWDEAAVYLFAGLQSLLICAVFAALYLVYGLKNKVTIFKVLFILLAALQLPRLAALFFSDSYVLYMLVSHHRALFADVVKVLPYFNYAISVLSIAFFVIVACVRKANTLLRVSSIIAAAVLLLALLVPVLQLAFGQELYGKLGREAYSSLSTLVSTVLGFLNWLSLIFFLAAMSFSKMKVQAGSQKEVAAKPDTVVI